MKHDKRKYEVPTVAAVDARQLLEALGPAHCQYGGGSTGTGSEVRVIRGSGGGRWHRR